MYWCICIQSETTEQQYILHDLVTDALKVTEDLKLFNSKYKYRYQEMKKYIAVYLRQLQRINNYCNRIPLAREYLQLEQFFRPSNPRFTSVDNILSHFKTFDEMESAVDGHPVKEYARTVCALDTNSYKYIDDVLSNFTTFQQLQEALE